MGPAWLSCREANTLRDLELPAPFLEFSNHHENEFMLRLADTLEISSLCNLKPFGDLRPGTSLQEAEEALGATGQEQANTADAGVVYAFPTSQGDIEILRQENVSGQHPGASVRWTLGLVPTMQRLEDHLESETVK
ncbi:MAG: hypothetical protein AAF725_20770, partial [Acidobacteriota bacterium]